MKKLLHILPTVNLEFGGPIFGVLGMSETYKKMDVDLTILTLDNKKDISSELDNIKIIALDANFFKYGISIKILKWLNNNSKNYDYIIINSLWSFTGLAVYLISKKKNLKYYIFAHGMLDPGLAKINFIKNLKKSIYFYLFENKVLSSANGVIFTCKEEALLARSSFNYRYYENHFIMNYGVPRPPNNNDIISSIIFDKYPQLRSKKIILFLSRIHTKKGCDLLIQALAICINSDDNLHLVMAGPVSDNYFTYLNNLIIKLNLTKYVTWVGMINGNEKWSFFYNSDIFCLPSHQENFGIAVVEALSCGLPVLITDKVNICEVISVAKAGFIDEDTVDGTVRNINRWLNLDKLDYSIMKTNALKCYQNNFNIESAVTSLLEILNSNSK